MRNLDWSLSLIMLANLESNRALVLSVRPAGTTRRFSAEINMSSGSGWGDLLGTLTSLGSGATAARMDNTVLTPKSRVKLGELSVSPIGAIQLT